MCAQIKLLFDTFKKSEDFVILDAHKEGTHVQQLKILRSMKICPPSYSQSSFPTVDEKPWCRKQSTPRFKISLYDGFVIIEDKLDLLRQRIGGCPSMGYASWVCDSCGQIAKHSAYRLTCCCRYCPDLDCTENRRLHSLLRLRSFGVKASKLLHFEIGFPHVEEITKEEVKKLRQSANFWMKEMEKLGSPIKALRILDILKKGQGYYLHFHFASLPVGDVRKFGQNCHLAREKVMGELQTSFIVRIEGYKPRKSLYDYFSKRMAGMFGHKKKGTAHTFSTMMSLEQYFEVFFKSKHLWNSLGWKAKPDSNLVTTVLNKPKACPHCSHNTFTLVSNRYLGVDDKPPDL